VRAIFLVGACALVACNFRVSGLQADGVGGGPDFAMPGGSGGSGGSGGVGNDMAQSPSGDMAHPAHGLLNVTSSSSSAMSSVDLTAVGTLDWAHWGFSKVTDFDHKATGNGQISDFVELANTTTKQFPSSITTFTWTDGLDGGGRHPTNPGGTTTSVYTNGSGGYRVVVIAGTTPRRLIFYAGLNNAQGRMQIALSDGSAPAHDSTYKQTNNNILDVVYTIDFAAASNGQQLSVSWSLDQDLGNVLNPSAVGIESAALTTMP
jgi:hypothetical protein